jgi:hypothetical protein
MRLRCLLLLAAVLTFPAWAAFPVAESNAVLISNSLFDRSPSVATDGQGNSVVVWSRALPPRVLVVARRFDPQGRPLGGILQVSSNGNQPTVAMNSRGNFVVAWLDALVAKPGAGHPMRVQLFAPNGAKLGRTTQLNTPVEAESGSAVIGIDQNGGFAANWSSLSGVYLRRFDSKGAPLGPQTLIDGDGRGSSLAMRPDGSFTLVWHGSDLLGRSYGADGVPIGADFKINQAAVNNSQNLTVAATQDGGFVAAWDICEPGATQACGVRARRFDAEARPLTGEFAVSPADGRSNERPIVAAEDARGYFAISWQSCLQDCRVSTQLYSPDSAPAPHVSTVTVGPDVTSPAIAASPAGFVVAFSSSACSHLVPGCHNTTPRGLYLWRFDFPQ